MLDPIAEIRRVSAVELAAIYERHELETRAFFEALAERLRVHGLNEEEIFGEVMEVIRLTGASQEYVSDDDPA